MSGDSALTSQRASTPHAYCLIVRLAGGMSSIIGEDSVSVRIARIGAFVFDVSAPVGSLTCG